MNRRSAIALLLAGFAALSYAPQASSEAGWVTLFDGNNLDNFDKIGDANWRLEDGVVVADKGNGFLVTKNSYTDYQIGQNSGSIRMPTAESSFAAPILRRWVPTTPMK